MGTKVEQTDVEDEESEEGEELTLPKISYADLQVGQKLRGTVRRIHSSNSWAFVDVGTAKLGFLHVARLTTRRVEGLVVSDILEVGEEIDVLVFEVDAPASKLALTMVDLSWLLDYQAEEEWLTGRVVEASKGTTVSISVKNPVGGQEVTGSLRKSQDPTWIDRSESDVGQEVSVKVMEVDFARGMISWTRRSKLDLTVCEELMANNTWLDGQVADIHTFGAFVAFNTPGGLVSGLVPLSLLSVDYVENASDVVKLGQDVKVRITKVDRKEKRITMSMRPMQDLKNFENVQSTHWLSGKVVGTGPNGILVSVQPPSGGAEVGLVRPSQICPDKGQNPSLEVTKGENVKVRVVKLDLESNRLELSLRPVPDYAAFAEVSDEAWLVGTVTCVTDKSAYFLVKPPNSDADSNGSKAEPQEGRLAADQVRIGTVGDMTEFLHRGQQVQVRLRQNGDLRKGKYLHLSMKDKPKLEGFVDLKDQWLNGSVVYVDESGISVGVAAPSSRNVQVGLVSPKLVTSDTFIDLADAYKIGQKVSVRVVGTDLAQGLLSLALTPKADVAGFKDVPQTSWLPGTVKEVAADALLVEVYPPSGPGGIPIGGSEQLGFVSRGEVRKVFVENLKDVASVGDVVRVRVVQASAKDQKLELSMRQLPDLSSYEGAAGSTIKGTVLFVADRVAIHMVVQSPNGAACTGVVTKDQIPDSLWGTIAVGQQVNSLRQVPSVDRCS
ncbi:unnamed protein product [Polarella glacialis]|uniref:S1 motif domain-containing protein n=1 Tax=Polarella glacialis TaxID=89957 RepID=A0A813F383_POLGL|nr:unnamed protein product [Polarella glacialis]